MEKQYQCIEYEFYFLERNRELKKFEVYLDRKTGIAEPAENPVAKEWTKLEFQKCSHCPLSEERFENCPLALNISGLAEIFADYSSFEKVLVKVRNEIRTYEKEMEFQDGLKSIMGIYFAASGCPHMKLLKPMAHFHLPFASIEETLFRHMGNFFLYEYFSREHKDGIQIDIKDISKYYRNIDQVSIGIYNRVSKVSKKDANKNAIVILNSYGQLMSFESTQNFESLRYLFEEQTSSGGIPSGNDG